MTRREGETETETGLTWAGISDREPFTKSRFEEEEGKKEDEKEEEEEFLGDSQLATATG